MSADNEYRQRFNREADIAATLWHPHIVGVHDRGEFEGQIWISMDYVEGTDAGRLLRERYPNGMPKAEVADIVTAVADALDYAHQRDLLHRDVKPANILLAHPESGEQRILLADFGIARWVNDISGLTATNMTVGTVSYAAPEQLMGGQLDGRADQYALAATAFHLLTGVPPFQHSNPAVVISQHLSASPPAIGARRPELSALDPVLAKALSKDPKDRFERCADFARALAHRLDAAPTGDVGTTFAPTALPPKRSLLRAGVIVPAILAVLLVAAITVAVIEFRRADRPEATSPTTKSPRSPPRRSRRCPRRRSLRARPPPQPPVAVIGANVLAGRQHGHDGRRGHRILLDAADHRRPRSGRSTMATSQSDRHRPSRPTNRCPIEEESPVRVCMQQTGQTRLRCREDIRRSNLGLP